MADYTLMLMLMAVRNAKSVILRADTYVPLDELPQLSDIVTLHTSLNADTHHLLNRRRIGQMKHGAYIIDTGFSSYDC